MRSSSPASALANPLLGQTLRYRVVAAPSPAPTATRQVATMAKKKGVRIIVTMECTEARGEGATPSRYTTQKVRRRRRCGGRGRGRSEQAAGPRWAACQTAHCNEQRNGASRRARLGAGRQRVRAGPVSPALPGRQLVAMPVDRAPLPAPAFLLQNRRNHPERLELKKFNPHLRRYTLHREIK